MVRMGSGEARPGQSAAPGAFRLCGVGALLLMTCGVARADIHVTVSFVFVEDEISPLQTEHRSNRSISYTLSGHGGASLSNTGRSYAGQLGHGGVATDDSGHQYWTRMDIQGHAFVIRSDFPSFAITTRITTDGVTSCSATREAHLKPGHRLFDETRVSNHDHMVLSSLRFENVSCAIGT